MLVTIDYREKELIDLCQLKLLETEPETEEVKGKRKEKEMKEGEGKKDSLETAPPTALSLSPLVGVGGEISKRNSVQTQRRAGTLFAPVCVCVSVYFVTRVHINIYTHIILSLYLRPFITHSRGV